MKIWKCVGLTLVVFVAYQVHLIRTTLGYSKEISFQNETCELLSFETPVEDLSALGDGHSVFAGGGDLWNALANGSASVLPGAVYLINGTEGTFRPLSIEWSDPHPKLVLHGIFFSQSSRRLYGVNHDEEHGESVEVFEVIEEGVPNSHRLKHLFSVRSPLFTNFALNDVVEGLGDEFYVTEWLPYGYAKGGKKSQTKTGLERLQHVGMVFFSLFKFSTTRVFRCKMGDSPNCHIASQQRFVGANGIAISEDRRTIFVNDAPSQRVTVLSRQADGMLTAIASFRTKHVLDNLEMDATGQLQGGTIPLLFTAATVCDEGLGATRMIDGRRVDCHTSPGGLLSIRRKLSWRDVNQTEIATHDGSKLSGISSALKVGSHKVIMGSPHSPGALVCDI